ncbi:MAG: hypothetical protein L6R38_002929 [Xanthoria sp. 2 TBL-2021]|nr:MAG: hypothetical protein L6R38_002929 [Xanthoria sp. 2 TBL-2021]
MLEHMAIKTREYDTAHTEAMKNSRQHIRLHDLKARGTHAPFAIDGVEGSSKEPTKLSFKGSILEDKGVFFDIEHRRMRRGGKTLFFVTYNGDHYLAEDNTESSQNLAAATTDKPAVFAAVKSGTAVNWHQLLAHAGSDAIQHLAGAAEGVKIEENTKVPPTNMCETCALSKARRIVSRSPAKLEAFDKP